MIKRHQYCHAVRVADLANAQGAKVTPEDLLPKKPTGMGPEVFARFEAAMNG